MAIYSSLCEKRRKINLIIYHKNLDKYRILMYNIAIAL